MNMFDQWGKQDVKKPSNNGITIDFKGDLAEQVFKMATPQQGPVTNNMGAAMNIPGVLNQGAPTSTALLGSMSPMADQNKGNGPLAALAALATGASLLGNNNQRQSFAPAVSGGGSFNAGNLINPYAMGRRR